MGLGLLSVFAAVLCCVGDEGDANLPLLAFDDSLFASFQREHIEADSVGREAHFLDGLLPNQLMLGHGLCRTCNGSLSALLRVLTCQYMLFMLSLKNDHTVISVFKFKAKGTNFSSKQRVACLLMYVASLMAASALFYGVRQKGIGDITSSFVISLLSTVPVFVCRTMFRKSAPRNVAATKKLPDNEIPAWKLETSLAVIERSKTYTSAMESIRNFKPG